MLADVRRAFRRAAKTAHPDSESGSKELFQRLVWAYNEVIANGATSSASGPSRWATEAMHSEDGFVKDWMRRNDLPANLGIYGNVAELEAETDDDGWGGRQALRDFFVFKHDGCIEGVVMEGALAIYRLSHAIGGRSWGVGLVEALQATYSKRNTGPAGRIFLHPLKELEGAMGTESSVGGPLMLVPDDCAEIDVCRVVDRLEVLQNGVQAVGPRQWSVLRDSYTYNRLVTSGKVHIAQCSSEEECDMPAAECIYCYEEGCELLE